MEAKADPQRGVGSETPAVGLDLWAEEVQGALRVWKGRGGQAAKSLQSQERANPAMAGGCSVSEKLPEAPPQLLQW